MTAMFRWFVEVKTEYSIFQGYLREGKCQLALGEAQAATCSFKKVLDLDPDNASAKTDVRNYCSKHMLN